jgi:hypothetical protein
MSVQEVILCFNRKDDKEEQVKWWLFLKLLNHRFVAECTVILT